jgi:hypothetical protein
VLAPITGLLVSPNTLPQPECRQQLVLCGAEVLYKLLAGAVPSGAGVLLWVLAGGKSGFLIGSPLFEGPPKNGLAAVN